MSPTVRLMSVGTTLDDSGIVTSSVAVLFGVSFGIGHLSPAPAPVQFAELNVYDGTDATGVKVATIKLHANDSYSNHAITFPAGVRCSRGIYVELNGNGHIEPTITVDFS